MPFAFSTRALTVSSVSLVLRVVRSISEKQVLSISGEQGSGRFAAIVWILEAIPSAEGT